MTEQIAYMERAIAALALELPAEVWENVRDKWHAARDSMTDKVEPFHAFDHHSNEYVIEHGNVATDEPSRVVLWPLALWREHRDSGGVMALVDGRWEPSVPLPMYPEGNVVGRFIARLRRWWRS